MRTIEQRAHILHTAYRYLRRNPSSAFARIRITRHRRNRALARALGKQAEHEICYTYLGTNADTKLTIYHTNDLTVNAPTVRSGSDLQFERVELHIFGDSQKRIRYRFGYEPKTNTLVWAHADYQWLTGTPKTCPECAAYINA